mgnify:CR=1 FL=1
MKALKDLEKRLDTVQETADKTIKGLEAALDEADRVATVEQNRLKKLVEDCRRAQHKAEHDLQTFQEEQNRSVREANRLTHITRDQVLFVVTLQLLGNTTRLLTCQCGTSHQMSELKSEVVAREAEISRLNREIKAARVDLAAARRRVESYSMNKDDLTQELHEEKAEQVCSWCCMCVPVAFRCSVMHGVLTPMKPGSHQP